MRGRRQHPHSAQGRTEGFFCQNRSGPAPVLAAIDAFGWTSSKDSRVMVTFTPVASVKASISATNASSSACTKYVQRSMESCPFRSGALDAALDREKRSATRDRLWHGGD